MATTKKQPTPEDVQESLAPAHEKKAAAKQQVELVREIPAQPSGKDETRLFQTSAGSKEWLTKDEAEKAGFFWLDEKTKKT